MAILSQETEDATTNSTDQGYRDLTKNWVVVLLETLREGTDLEDRSVAREILVDMGVAC